MDQILQSLSIGHLLRSVFSGVFFVISYSTAVFSRKCFLMELNGIETSKLLSLALFVGVIAYSIHRAALYPFIELAFDSDCAIARRKTGGFRRRFIRESTIQKLLTRWARAAEKAENRSCELAKHISTWADYTHLLYVSALCIGLGAWAGALSSEVKWNWILILVGVALLVSALFSDWRLRSVDEACEEFLNKKLSEEAKARLANDHSTTTSAS